jgi:hypothetical protein
MIATLEPVRTSSPTAKLNALIDEIGPVRVLLIAAAALARRPFKSRLPNESDLSNHLRKDVGLKPIEPPPPFRRPIF